MIDLNLVAVSTGAKPSANADHPQIEAPPGIGTTKDLRVRTGSLRGSFDLYF